MYICGGRALRPGTASTPASATESAHPAPAHSAEAHTANERIEQEQRQNIPDAAATESTTVAAIAAAVYDCRDVSGGHTVTVRKRHILYLQFFKIFLIFMSSALRTAGVIIIYGA